MLQLYLHLHFFLFIFFPFLSSITIVFWHSNVCSLSPLLCGIWYGLINIKYATQFIWNNSHWPLIITQCPLYSLLSNLCVQSQACTQTHGRAGTLNGANALSSSFTFFIAAFITASSLTPKLPLCSWWDMGGAGSHPWQWWIWQEESVNDIPPLMAGATSHTFAFPFIIPAFIIMGWLPDLITVLG